MKLVDLGRAQLRCRGERAVLEDRNCCVFGRFTNCRKQPHATRPFATTLGAAICPIIGPAPIAKWVGLVRPHRRVGNRPASCAGGSLHAGLSADGLHMRVAFGRALWFVTPTLPARHAQFLRCSEGLIHVVEDSRGAVRMITTPPKILHWRSREKPGARNGLQFHGRIYGQILIAGHDHRPRAETTADHSMIFSSPLISSVMRAQRELFLSPPQR